MSSKAAAFSLTQSLRMLLASQGVRVHAVLTGPVDTDMARDLDIPKASPQSVAQGIFDAVEIGEEDIFPDPLSEALADGWRAGPAKALERQNAALLQPQPVTAWPCQAKETPTARSGADHRGALAGSRADAADVTPHRRAGPARLL
jgi:NAD(P)-dependent dehydrogenase (short-subunit alcohol dehydrogenase family)